LPELEEAFIKTATLEAYRIATNNYTADSLMSNRDRFEAKVKELLSKQLEPEGFILQQLTSSLTPPQSLRDAINAKNMAIQKAMQVENEVKKEQAQAQINVAKARGDAEALRIQADAEAYANEKRQASLTPLVVQQQFIQKWNGVLPQYGSVPQIFKDVAK